MAQPTWVTPAGSLGTYTPTKLLHIVLLANPSVGAKTVTYSILNGNLPAPLSLTENGVIDGYPATVANDTTNTFTVRATDSYSKIADRTFSLTILGELQPSFTTTKGNILTVVDSTWVEYQLLYSKPVELSSVKVTLYSGSLPPGLEMNNLGLIRGYPKPPKTSTGIPIKQAYSFTVKLENDLGTAIQSFSITVLNNLLNKSANSRKPQILNNKPLSFNIPPSDPYYGYYIPYNDIPTIKSGSNFTFKIIGYDFENDDIIYEFINLPYGLTANSTTGWVTGTIVINGEGFNSYNFSVRVKKKNFPTAISQIYNFSIKVTNNVSTKVNWVTNYYLGIINNNTISELKINATASHSLQYKLISGNLPPNLTLLETGEIAGKVANEVNTTLSKFGSNTTFKFTVEAFSPNYPLLKDTREFTLIVKQYYTVPTETMYFKATPNFADRAIINSLLTDTNLIPTEYLYRPNDIYFGKAKEIKFVQVYGIKASTIEKYISAINKNHYWRQITLGNLKTAIAKDDFGNVLYEVVYSEVIDNLATPSGVSVSKEIALPRSIDTTNGNNIDSRTDLYTSYETDMNASVNYFAGMGSNLVNTLYPASFDNMRKQIASVLEENYDSKLLPRWMSSQQANGSILGFQQAWVICYTKPGYAETVKNNINNNWGHKLNEIYFLIDRYTVDKSSTFDFNNYVSPKSWEKLPSASPQPDPLDSHDFYVLFPQKTILPK